MFIKSIMEMAVFKMQENVTDLQILELSNAFTEELKREMKGFLKCTTMAELQAYCAVMTEDGSDLIYLEERG